LYLTEERLRESLALLGEVEGSGLVGASSGRQERILRRRRGYEAHPFNSLHIAPNLAVGIAQIDEGTASRRPAMEPLLGQYEFSIPGMASYCVVSNHPSEPHQLRITQYANGNPILSEEPLLCDDSTGVWAPGSKPAPKVTFRDYHSGKAMILRANDQFDAKRIAGE